LWFVKVARCADRSYQLFELNLVIVGDGTSVEKGAFLVRNGLIVQVGRAGEMPVPAGAAIVDLKDRFAP